MLKAGHLLMEFGPALPFETSIVWSVLYKANTDLFIAICEYFDQPKNLDQRNAWRRVRLLSKDENAIGGIESSLKVIQPKVEPIDLEKETEFFPATTPSIPLRLTRLTMIDDEPAPLCKGPTGMPKLREEDRAKLHALIQRNDDEIICETVPARHMKLLGPQEWLSDEIINSYVSLVAAKYESCYSFSSWFYEKLKKGQDVTRWAKKVDLFSFRLLIIPVYLTAHWCIIIVDNNQKQIEYFDSFHRKNEKFYPPVQKYLNSRWKAKYKTECPKYTESRMLKDYPRQYNGHDCGAFALCAAEYRARGATLDYVEADMPYFRQKMLLELANKEIMTVQ